MKKKVGLKILIVAATFALSLLGLAVGKMTATAAGGIYAGGGTIDINGGTIDSEVLVSGATCNYYDATFGSDGYIALDLDCYVTIMRVPTKELKIAVKTTSNLTKVATFRGVKPDITNITVTNLPSDMELALSGEDVIIRNKNCVVHFNCNDTSYGTLSATLVSIPYGTTYSASGNSIIFSSGYTVTATPTESTAQYTYSFDSWSKTSGTITSNTTITANFTQTTRSYIVTISRNNSGYGSCSVSSLSVPYGTTYTASSNTLTFSNKRTVAASPYSGFSFSSWSSTSGTITASTTITANFKFNGTEYKVSFTTGTTGLGAFNSEGDIVSGLRKSVMPMALASGSVSPTSVTVPSGTTYSTSSATITFAYSGRTVATARASGRTVGSTTYSFSHWSSPSGTITAATTITAFFSARGGGIIWALPEYAEDYPAPQRGKDIYFDDKKNPAALVSKKELPTLK